MLSGRFLKRCWIVPLLLNAAATGLSNAVQASPACDGTRFELAVREQGVSPAEHFRFSLAVTGEGRSEQAVMQLLNRRLGRLRRELQPIVQGTLTVSAPRSHRHLNDEERRFQASAAVSADVNAANFNRFIQTVGAMPGVRQQGMRSMANAAAEQRLQQTLMAKAISRGKAEAQAAAQVIGSRQVRLISIQRGDSFQGPRPMRLNSAAEGFDPQQAPSPQTSVGLKLVYCLS